MNRAMYNEVEIFHLSKSFAFNSCFTGYNTDIQTKEHCINEYKSAFVLKALSHYLYERKV